MCCSVQSLVAIHAEHNRMNRSYRFVLLLPLLFVLTTLVASAQNQEREQTFHDPTLNREADKEYKEGRKRWMEAMHRAEPGVSTTVINEEIRRAKRAVHEKSSGNLLSDDSQVAITNGLVGHWNERGSNNQAGRTLAADVDFETSTVYVAADGGTRFGAAVCRARTGLP